MIFGSLRKDPENKAVAVAFIMTWDEDVDGADAAPGRLAGFRRELYLSQPDAETSTVTSRYGTAVASSWNRAHPKLKARGAWEGHQGALPVIEGTLIRLTVDHLPHDRAPKPVWLWTSRPDADPAEADLCWQAFLRRFDLEHTFRFLKQALGWTRPKLRDPRRGRPLDLARHRRLRPAAARPPPGRRPPPALAAALPARPAHPGPRPPRLSRLNNKLRPRHHGQRRAHVRRGGARALAARLGGQHHLGHDRGAARRVARDGTDTQVVGRFCARLRPILPIREPAFELS